MISAKEAREETYKKIESNMENELILVEKKIKEAIQKSEVPATPSEAHIEKNTDRKPEPVAVPVCF